MIVVISRVPAVLGIKLNSITQSIRFRSYLTNSLEVVSLGPCKTSIKTPQRAKQKQNLELATIDDNGVHLCGSPS